MSSPDNDKILIIGAGIGGLALAQGLRKQNIPFEVFERDAAQKSRAQGWAVALVESLKDLPEYLPNDLGDIRSTSVNHGSEDAEDHIGIVDMDTGETLGVIGHDPSGRDHLLRAGRERFREYLWQHIPVSTGKHFSHYETDANGVTVFFKDGTHARGSLLIGADGASSHVREQLLGPERSAAELSSYIPLIAELTLTEEQYAPISAVANCGVLCGNASFRLVIGRRSFNGTGETADYFLVICWTSTQPSVDAAWAHTASKQALYDKVASYADQIPESLRYIFTLLRPEHIVTPPIRFLEFVPPEVMPRGRVTVLGDAAHPMVPFRGAGANTAMLDAIDLTRLIAQHHLCQEDTGSWEDVIDAYNSVMTVRGQANVLGSRRAGAVKIGRPTFDSIGRISVSVVDEAGHDNDHGPSPAATGPGPNVPVHRVASAVAAR